MAKNDFEYFCIGVDTTRKKINSESDSEINWYNPK